MPVPLVTVGRCHVTPDQAGPCQGSLCENLAECAARVTVVFASFGLGAEGMAELRARFAAWPRT